MSSTLQFRPRFKLLTDASPDEVATSIKEHLQHHNSEGVRVRHIGQHIVLSTDPEKRHFWSPQLDISMDDSEGDQTVLRCLIAPMPAIWTLYVFLYSVLGLGGIVALMAGFSQWALDHSPWAWYFLPVAAIGAVLMILFAKFGQQLALEEMQLLKGVLFEALGISSELQEADVVSGRQAARPFSS